MSKMTFSQAKKLLPPFARGLATYAVTVAALREAISVELADSFEDNPLEPKQREALRKFLERTA